MKIHACWMLSRPLNCLIALGSVIIGGALGGSILTGFLALAALSAAFITAGANAVNDAYDAEVDRINKPGRPIPSGKISIRSAMRFGIAMLALGVVLSIPVPNFAPAMAFVSAILCFFYSRSLKKTLWWGNLTVALVSSSAFVYGGLAAGEWRRPLFAGLFAFLFHLAREIVKDMEDMQGDRIRDVHSLALRFGLRHAMGWVTAILLVLIAVTPIPTLAGLFKSSYLWVVIPGVDCFLLLLLFSLWRRMDRTHLARWAVWMKADMAVGLLALIVGS